MCTLLRIFRETRACYAIVANATQNSPSKSVKFAGYIICQIFNQLSFIYHSAPTMMWFIDILNCLVQFSREAWKSQNVFPRSCIADELVFFAHWKRAFADSSNNKRSRSYVIVRTTILELATNSLRTQKRRATHKAADDCRLRSGLPMNNTFMSSCFTRVTRFHKLTLKNC